MILHEGKIVNINIGSIKAVQIIDVLGTGGFANVFKVRDISNHKNYVLKHIQIKPSLTGKEKDVLVERVKNEGSVKIPSKYIVSHIGVNEFEKDNFAILSDFIEETKDLSDWILDNKSTSWKNKQTLFVKILKGVHDAHSMNIIHRDLKPQNILITKDNEPKIIDFGFAKFKDKSVTVTGEFFGTMPYLDPSALLNGSKYVDARCDVYAMGVILHQLICGVHYWVVADIEFPQLVKIITSGDANNILEIDKVGASVDGNEMLKNIIKQATTFDCNIRINSVNEMISMLGDTPIFKEYPKVDFTITSPILLIEDGSAKGAINMITLKDGEIRELNRKNLDITNKTISRRNHAFIERSGDQYFIFEGEGTGGKGTNGTYLNGKRIKTWEKK